MVGRCGGIVSPGDKAVIPSGAGGSVALEKQSIYFNFTRIAVSGALVGHNVMLVGVVRGIDVTVTVAKCVD